MGWRSEEEQYPTAHQVRSTGTFPVGPCVCQQGITSMTKYQLVPAALVLIFSVGGARAQDVPKPGPEHEKLKQLTGEFDAKVKLHVPGAPAQESKADYKARLDVGGLFLVSEYNGKLLGGNYQGHGLVGYDPHKKKYVGVWVDSMNPSIYSVEGAFDKSGKVFTEAMEGPDPAGKPMKMRMVT